MMTFAQRLRRSAPSILSAIVLAATLLVSSLVLFANHLAHNPGGIPIEELAIGRSTSPLGNQVITITVPDLASENKAIYFSGLQGPVSLHAGERQLAEFGSFATGKAPRSQDAVFELTKELSNSKINIEWGRSSLSNRASKVPIRAILADSSDGQTVKFLKEFVSSYSFIGIGTTLLLLGSLIMLFSAMDRTGTRPTWLFGFALIGQGIVALYFSRIFFEVPILDQTSIHVPAFLTYLASTGAYFWYFSTEPSKVSRVLKFWATIPFLGLVCVAISLAYFGFSNAVSVYKYSLIATLPGWYLTALAIILSREKSGVSFKVTPFVFLSLSVSAVLVALAQTNDVLRAFAITIFPYNIGPLIFFFCSVLILVHIAIEFSVRQRYILDSERKIALSEMVTAISHDVRKPLSMAKVLISTVQEMNSPDEIRDFTLAALPEVQKSIDSVDGLLQDVMQVGATSVSLQKETVTPEFVVDGVLDQIFRGHPESDISISYVAKEKIFVEIDVSKSARIFSNIISNACQAINWRGKISIHVSSKKDRVLFRIQNQGSYIPNENIPQLFNAFFTSNKRGGTGLGLAIAKKWTEAHGGRISCHSQKDAIFPAGMVEFSFDLPRSKESNASLRPEIPGHSSAYKMSIGLEDRRLTANALASQVGELRKVLEGRGKEIRIVLLDDEEPYLTGVKTTLSALNLSPLLTLESFTFEPPGGLNSGDLFLIDYDLDRSDRNGADIIRDLKKMHASAFLCLHTNRTDGATLRHALEAGADAVYPKPLSSEHLVKLLWQVVDRRSKSLPESEASTQKPKKIGRFRVAFIEDMLVMRLTWKIALGELVDLSLFTSPEEFIANNGKFDLVVTDLNFDNSTSSGADVAKWVSSRTPNVKVYLCSNQDDVDMQHFHHRIPKDAMPSAELLGLTSV